MKYKEFTFNPLILVFFLTASATCSFAQDDAPRMPTSKEEYQKQYQRNIKKSRIDGVYIPANLDEAFAELDALSPEQSKMKFKNASEDIISRKLHFGLGKWIKVNWNFEEGSRYVKHLEELGLTDHDHMIQFTIVSYHRYMNKRPLEIEKRVEMYKKERQKYLDELKSRRQIIHSEERKIEKKN